ncbi:MAG: hypothetical protein RL748_1193 [Pseudomonadota bacterium]|jgi:predicted membrane protein
MKYSKNQKRMVMGVLIIAFGVLALLENVLRGLRLVQFWPMVFIVVGAMKIVQTEHRNGYILGGFFVALGCLMTASNLGLIHFRLRDWWPLILIGAGVLMVLKAREQDGDAASGAIGKGVEVPGVLEKSSASGASIDCFAIMSGNKINVVSQAFSGGEATAIMGGVEIDCSAASIEKTAVLHVFSIWGGIEIRVPNDWTVINRVTPIMGGVDDKTVPPLIKDKTLVLEGFVLMAGVEIRNS